MTASATPCLAVCNLSRLKAWLEKIFGTSVDLMPAAFMLADDGVNALLRNELGEAGISLIDREEGYLLQADDATGMIEAIKRLRLERKMSALRYASWGLTLGDKRGGGIRAATAYARAATPPNDMCVVESQLLKIIGLPGRGSLVGVPAPYGAQFLDLDEASNKLEQAYPNPGVGDQPIAFGDTSGTQAWVEAVGRLLPEDEQKTALTKFCDAVQDGIEEVIKATGDSASIEGKTGVGADGIHLVGKSADRLLRTIVWVQSNLASHGAALLPWGLGFGKPQFAKNGQPSDPEFQKLHAVVEHGRNGDVWVSDTYASQLMRPELRMLLNPIQSDKERVYYEVQWWQYPFRN